jgi:hypothetical protein
MVCHPHVVLPATRGSPPAKPGTWNPGRERSWALRGLWPYHMADLARLEEISDELLACSRRIRRILRRTALLTPSAARASDPYV